MFVEGEGHPIANSAYLSVSKLIVAWLEGACMHERGCVSKLFTTSLFIAPTRQPHIYHVVEKWN